MLCDCNRVSIGDWVSLTPLNSTRSHLPQTVFLTALASASVNVCMCVGVDVRGRVALRKGVV